MAPSIFRLMVSERYLTGSEGRLIGAIGLAGLFTGVYQMSTHPISFARATRYVPFITVFAAIVKTGINWIFIPKSGGIVAAYSTVIAFLICALLTWAVSKRVADVPTSGWRVSVVLALAVVCSLIAGAFPQFSAISLIGGVWSVAMVCIVAFVGVFLFRRSFEDFVSQRSI
ncbi:MAG: polysaccharide biosynthesis C-terminal domain-containing protein [Verrucomicrobiales bacterium]